MKRLQIDHLTEYHFAASSTLMPHRLMLRPREDHSVRIASSALSIEPTATLRWQRDPLDNSVAIATFAAPGDVLRIASRVVIEHFEETPLDFIVEAPAVSYPFQYGTKDACLLQPFLQPCWPGDGSQLDAWLARDVLSGSPIETFVLLDRMNRAIHNRYRYTVREEPGVQSPATTLALRAGSCRDLATLFMEACRRLGLASRFVSGYLHCPTHAPAPGVGATHAWADVYLPGPGWKGFDPTLPSLAGTDHIAVAVAQHPEDVPPVAGAFLGPPGQQPELRVAVHVMTV
ncbi:MAG: transglutaminase family protein [Myxococcales bacterium]|nr:transglutaminase family protein [Myxococcales bacterium]MDD9966981.1 transglutaminase family protein [Myxococcales bacterium]